MVSFLKLFGARTAEDGKAPSRRTAAPARALQPAGNEQRMGIAYYLAAELASMGLPGDTPARLMVLDAEAVGQPLAQGQATVGDVLVHGVRLHPYLLAAGSYTVRLEVADAAWEARLEVPQPTELQARIGRSCRDHGTPVIFSGACDSRHYPYSVNELVPWFDRADWADTLQAWRAQGRITEIEHRRLDEFCRLGYLIMEDAIDPGLVAEVNREIDGVVAREEGGYTWGSSQRIEQLHTRHAGMRRLWLNESCRSMVDLIFQGRSRPCQTLTFVFGSQQDAHQDTVHLTPFPAGYMCGVWIALQDIREGSGELVVYPGSHREPRLRLAERDCPKVEGNWETFGRKVVPAWGEMLSRHQPVVYRPRSGTALIWHENLLHAGSVREHADLERRSVVIHYFSDDAIAYYDSTGQPAMAAPTSLLT